jgi:hypothetical protein
MKTKVSGCDLWLVTFPSAIIAGSWAMTQISLPAGTDAAADWESSDVGDAPYRRATHDPW